jgi:hypothetical protein
MSVPNTTCAATQRGVEIEGVEPDAEFLAKAMEVGIGT